MEVYFKAADVLVIPYTEIFQSGVPFLAYSFGVPVVASDVGSLREDIVEGKTGFICMPRDGRDIARAVRVYRSSEMCRNPESIARDPRVRQRPLLLDARRGITESVYRQIISVA